MDSSESDSAIAGSPADGGTLDLFGSGSDLGVRPAKPTPPRPTPAPPLPGLPAIIDLPFEPPTALAVIEPEPDARLGMIFAALREAKAASLATGYDTPDAPDADFISKLDLDRFTDRYIVGAPVFLRGQPAWQTAVLRHRLVEPLLAAKSGCHNEPLDDIVAWLVEAGYLHGTLADVRKEEVDDICAEFLGFRRPQDIIGSWFDTLWSGRLACYRFDDFESQSWVFLNDRSLSDARNLDYVPWLHRFPEPREHAYVEPVEPTTQSDFPGDDGYVRQDDAADGPPVFEQVPLEAYEQGGYDPDDGRDPDGEWVPPAP